MTQPNCMTLIHFLIGIKPPLGMITFTNGRASAGQQQDFGQALTVLRDGGLLLYPTDTVWSVGCDATDPEALRRLRAMKSIDQHECLELLVDSPKMLKQYIAHFHPRIETLLSFHLRPLTVRYERGRNLPQEALDQEGSIAIRIVQDEYCQSLIRKLGRPIVALPADLKPGSFPANFGAISSDIIEQVDYIVHHRRNDKSIAQPSVMVQLGHKDELEFLRE